MTEIKIVREDEKATAILKAIRQIDDGKELGPVRHGRWVKRPNTKGQVYCSECGTLEEVTDNNFKSKHCPNCGAQMK